MEIEQEVVDCVKDLVKKVVKKEYHKQYYENNKEKIKASNKKYGDNNKEKKKEYQIKYSKTPNGKKTNRISKWKRYGIITDNYDALYDHYLKTAYCDACRVKLTYDRHNTATTKVVDHDHKIRDAPNFRNILCHSCNSKRRY